MTVTTPSPANAAASPPPLAALSPGDVHPPQVAGMFYAADPTALRAELTEAIAARGPDGGVAPKIVVAPHAGLRFSARIAATAFAPWTRAATPIRRVVVFGPAHRRAVAGLAVHPAHAFATPLGRLPVDWSAVSVLLPLDRVHLDARPFEGEHSIEMLLVVLQAMLPEPFEIVPILVGDASPHEVAAVIERLWGGPETGIAISSDLSHYLDLTTATGMDRETARRIETCDPAGLDGNRACGHRIVAGALRLAEARDLRITTLGLTTSQPVTGDAQRVVGYGAFAFEAAASARLTEADGRLLVDTTIAGLARAVSLGGEVPHLVADAGVSPTLMAHRATFVTLERGDGHLRGCIGSLAPVRPLLADALINAVKAGFSDPRFGPLQADELADLDLSISILSRPRDMGVHSLQELIEALEPDRDGLILADQGRSALFLPSVWSGLPEARDFVRQLQRKAGLPIDHWSATTTAKRFRVEKLGGRVRPIDEANLKPLRFVETKPG